MKYYWLKLIKFDTIHYPCFLFQADFKVSQCRPWLVQYICYVGNVTNVLILILKQIILTIYWFTFIESLTIFFLVNDYKWE